MKRSCQDCRHYRNQNEIEMSGTIDFGDGRQIPVVGKVHSIRRIPREGKCAAPQIQHIKVAAIRRLPWHYASMLRAYGWFTAWRVGFCGKRGRWWEPRAELRPGSNPPPPDISRKPLAPAGPAPRRNDFGFPVAADDPIIPQPKGRPIA